VTRIAAGALETAAIGPAVAAGRVAARASVPGPTGSATLTVATLTVAARAAAAREPTPVGRTRTGVAIAAVRRSFAAACRSVAPTIAAAAVVLAALTVSAMRS
jgi:hypothetical protein